MAKALNTVLASLCFLGISIMSCTPKNTAETAALMSDSSQLNQPAAQNNPAGFIGKYISPKPAKIDKGSYYTGLIIAAISNSDSLNVQFSSAKIKKQICCSFAGNGYMKKDTLFVPIRITGYPNAVMIITRNTGDSAEEGSIVVSTLDSTQANALMSFCCTGASLSGNYFHCDLSLFQTDTTKANESTDLLR